MIKWKGAEYEDPGLPPAEYWLVDPRREKIETPVDERKLVVVPALIDAVKATIDPAYKWTQPCDVHHFEWPACNYPYVTGQSSANPDAFRELPIHKGVVPRGFHNWLHAVTLPPPVPDPEVMMYRVEAWMVARALFGEVRNVVRWERRMRRRALQLASPQPKTLPAGFNGVDVIGREIMAEVLASNFKGMERHLARLDNIPQEYRLFEPTESPLDLATTLGRIVMPHSMLLTHEVAA